MKTLKLENFKIGNQEPMTLMGGVNVLESESIVMTVAEKFAQTTEKLNINWILRGLLIKPIEALFLHLEVQGLMKV